MSLGQLTVRLGLDAADFTSGMTKSELQAKRFADNLDRNIAAGIIKAEIALRALGTAAKVTFETFKTLTTGAADFKDLEESTGASAESLASLAVAAGTAGVEMSDVATAANKLTKNLVGVDDESAAAGAALKAIGIEVKKFKELDPVAQYQAVGKALEGYADGAGKVAVAQALFGKSGAEQLRVFKALEEAGGTQTILTQRQIELADEYADKQAKAAAELRMYAQAAATEAIPALMDLAKAGTEFLKALLGVDEQTKQLTANNAVREFAEDGAYAVAVLAESLVGVAKAARALGGSFQSVGADIKFLATVGKAALPMSAPDWVSGKAAKDIKDALEARNKAAKEANDRYVDLWNYDGTRMSRAIRKAQQDRRSGLDIDIGGGGDWEPTKPKINYEGADTTGAARMKKMLDGQIKAIRDFAQQQADAFDFANKYAKGSYDDGLFSLQQFFDEQNRIRDAGLDAQLEALDKEKAALQAALPKSKNADRIDIENKIADVVAKRAEVSMKAGRDTILATQEEARSLKQLKDRYDDLRATIMQLGGNSSGAAGIRIAQQVADARKLLTQSGQDPAEADVLERLLKQTEDLNQAQRDYGRLVDSARTSEELLLLAAQESGQSEIETLQALGAGRQKALEQMAEMVDKARQLAALLGTPEAIQYAERLGLAFKKATAEADPLLQKIRDIGGEAGKSIASNFEDAAIEGRSLRDTLKGIESDLVRIAWRALITKPVGDYLTNLIGGNGQASGGGGWIGAAASFFGSMFGGGKAIGGPTMPNTLYQVGERRPEVYDDGSSQWLLTGSRRGRIDPNPGMGSGGRSLHITQTFVIDGQVNRKSQAQVASTAARSVAAASARYN